MAQAPATTGRYQADFQNLAPSRAQEPDWLCELREEGFANFERIGFPVGAKRDEAWKYTNVQPIVDTDFRIVAEPGLAPNLSDVIPDDGDAMRLVFVDGHWSEEHSSALHASGLTVARLADAVLHHEGLIRTHIARFAELGHDSFVPLNSAFYRDGVFIHATGTGDRPIHAVFVTTEHSEPVVTYPRILLIAGAMSEVTLVETYLSLGGQNHFTDSVTEIDLHEGSHVRHVRLLLENEASYQVAHVRPFLGRDSTFDSVVFEAGGGLARLDLETVICEPGASATLRGLYITGGEQHMDNLVSIDHRSPHGTSRLYYKGILDGESSAVFGGTVFVRKGADKTDSHQEDKNLVLSEKAVVYSKPALEIYADDVKAGHGATAGAVADEALFYMQSRGISADEAMRLLVQGFASDILDHVPVEPLRAWLEGRALSALPRFKED